MSNPTVPIEIWFISHEQRGRTKLPGVGRYAVTSTHPKAGSNWSVVCDLREPTLKELNPPAYDLRLYTGSRVMVGSMSYLVEDAPHHLLQPGEIFHLWEGHRLVAIVIVKETP
jgi:hypothetical protein